MDLQLSIRDMPQGIKQIEVEMSEEDKKMNVIQDTIDLSQLPLDPFDDDN